MSFQPPGGPPPPPPPGGPLPPGNPYPPQGYPGQWPQQQPWGAGPPPKKRGNGWKWGLGALAVLVVIGVTAAVTISVTKDGDGDGPSPTGETFGLASADDKGPANIITEDPSCAAWRPLIDTLAKTEKNGWDKIDRAIPAARWTGDQRRQHDEVARVMRTTADQAVQLAKLTPHRVMRELYEQFIAYTRAYVEALPTYTQPDNELAGVSGASSNAITRICTTIEYGIAEARGPLVPAPPNPSEVAPVTNPDSPQQFLETGDPTCSDWLQRLAKFGDDTTAWQELDPGLTASEWDARQRDLIDAVIPVMETMADDMEQLGLRSTNPTLQDFAILAAQYRRAYAMALPSYTGEDSYLAGVSAAITSAIADACRASES